MKEVYVISVVKKKEKERRRKGAEKHVALRLRSHPNGLESASPKMCHDAQNPNPSSKP